MHKIHTLSKFFKCNICEERLENPVGLPCVETICKKHVNQFLNSSNNFECPFCNEKHSLPPNGFPIEKRINEMLNYQIDKIDFHNINPKFKECRKALNELNCQIDELKMIEENPEGFICNYFEKIINQVDLHREVLKEEIDNYSLKTIEQIKRNLKQFQLNEMILNEVTLEFEDIRNNLNMLNNQFRSFDISDAKIDEIMAKVKELKSKSVSELDKFKNAILKNKTFEFKEGQLNIEDIFGNFVKREVCGNKIFV